MRLAQIRNGRNFSRCSCRKTKEVRWQLLLVVFKLTRVINIFLENGKHLELFAVSFELPKATIFERLKNREKKTGKFIPKEVILEQINSFNIPTTDEGFDAIERIT